MHKQVVIISLSVLCAAVAISGETCVSDSKIIPEFLKSFREILGNSTSEYLSFGEDKFGHFGFDASWKKGTVGNFSTARLVDGGRLSSGQMCTTGNVRRLTLDMNVQFDELSAHYEDFVFSIPLFKTTSSWAIFTTTGSNAVVTMSASQDVTSKQCSISLDNFQFNSWGIIEVRLGGNDGRNLVAETIFNANRNKIVKFLSKAGVGDKINNFVHSRLAEALETHVAAVCDIMASN
uniref:Uncharacterized protein n=1 Tax=Lygus hesperus TaxID=30085 RepID=A0A146LYU7_LYGHE